LEIQQHILLELFTSERVATANINLAALPVTHHWSSFCDISFCYFPPVFTSVQQSQTNV